MGTPTARAERGLLELPGTAGGWIWAFTCPTPECPCRTALVLSVPGDREALIERGRPVADAWRGDGHYAEVAETLGGLTAFAVDFDTHEVFRPVGETPLDVETHADVKAVVDRLDDDVLDAIARIWHLGKGREPPADPGAGGAKIEVQNWRPGDLVAWDDARPSLRADTPTCSETASSKRSSSTAWSPIVAAGS